MGIESRENGCEERNGRCEPRERDGINHERHSQRKSGDEGKGVKIMIRKMGIENRETDSKREMDDAS